MTDHRPIIILRKRKKHKHAHHGGTWKIAYADFMTAMMAFFLVMWLLSQSTDMQRELIADYFRTPLTVALSQGNKNSLSDSVIPGGGDDLIKQKGEVYKGSLDAFKRHTMQRSLKQAQTKLQQMIETDPRLNNFKSNLLLTLTNDGLLIQITDSENRPMFKLGSERPETYMNDILQALVPLLNELPNKLSLTGHTDVRPYARGDVGYGNWELSAGRANAARRALVSGGLDDQRVLRVIGTGSHMLLENIEPTDPRNRRITILVLTAAKEQEIREENTLTQPEEGIVPNAQMIQVQGYTDGHE